MTVDERIQELMGLHKEQLARMIAESENHDDSAAHDTETAAIAAEVNGEPMQFPTIDASVEAPAQ